MAFLPPCPPTRPRSPPPPLSRIRVHVSLPHPFVPFILNGSQNTQSIQTLVVLLVPGLTSTVISLLSLPTSGLSHGEPQSTIPAPPPPDSLPPAPSKPQDLPSSIDSRSEVAALQSGIAHRAIQHPCSPPSTRFPDQCQ